MATLEIPEPSMVLLVGASGCGKSTFARRHFGATEVISSDHCRALISDDENDQTVSRDAFEILHLIADKRLHAGRLTVVDATNVHPDARASLIAVAARHQTPAVAVVFALPEAVCLAHNAARTERTVPPEVIRKQLADLEASLPGLAAEGFERIHMLRSVEDVRGAAVARIR